MCRRTLLSAFILCVVSMPAFGQHLKTLSKRGNRTQIIGTSLFRGHLRSTMSMLFAAVIMLLSLEPAQCQNRLTAQSLDSSKTIGHLLTRGPVSESFSMHQLPLKLNLAGIGSGDAGLPGDFRSSKVIHEDASPLMMLSVKPVSQNLFHVNPLKVAGVSAVALVGLFYLERYQEQAWWHGHTTQFRFVNDGSFAGNFDKLGHTFGAYIQSSAVTNAMEWSGFDPKTAAYIGFAAALLQQTYIEVNDGVTKFWGFSPGDMFSNIIGSAYPLAQTTFPELKHFTPKFSYHTSTQYKKVHWAQSYIDDYEGLTFWMSVDVHHYLPASIKPYWPSFLNLALGTGLRNYVEEESWQHTVFISFDINMQKLPGNGPILSTLKTVLNYVHLPMPALMVSPKIVGVALKF